MKFKLHTNQGALNSGPVFAALSQGIQKMGFSVVNHGHDVDVIWSVLWHGRMQQNQQIYNQCVTNQRPVMIIEVGNLVRGHTWRVSLNHINAKGIFGNCENLDSQRPQALGITLQAHKDKRKEHILIAAQHERSLQWQGQPSMVNWVQQKIQEIRQFSSRPIVVRPHPRSLFRLDMPGVTLQLPNKLVNTYDSFDIDYNFHCVINHNSGPAVQAAIFGIPVICDQSSLAFPVSAVIENIETVTLPDRQQWLTQLSHTEWTVAEIAEGTPVKRLLSHLEKYLENP